MVYNLCRRLAQGLGVLLRVSYEYRRCRRASLLRRIQLLDVHLASYSIIALLPSSGTSRGQVIPSTYLTHTRSHARIRVEMLRGMSISRLGLAPPGLPRLHRRISLLKHMERLPLSRASKIDASWPCNSSARRLIHAQRSWTTLSGPCGVASRPTHQNCVVPPIPAPRLLSSLPLAVVR